MKEKNHTDILERGSSFKPPHVCDCVICLCLERVQVPYSPCVAMHLRLIRYEEMVAAIVPIVKCIIRLEP